VGYANEVTEHFLQSFKSGDLVDVRGPRRRQPAWSGPHKLLAYKLDPPSNGAKPAAYMEIDLGDGKKLERWLIVGEQQVIRKHTPEEQRQRVRVKRVKT
jgi:hypothetical protein